MNSPEAVREFYHREGYAAVRQAFTPAELREMLDGIPGLHESDDGLQRERELRGGVASRAAPPPVPQETIR